MYMKVHKIFFTVSIILILQNAKVLGNIVNRQNDRFSLDISGCALYHKLCSHFDDDLDILRCALDASYNKTQVSPLCQHKLWSYQNILLDNVYLEYKLKEACQEQSEILKCFNPSKDSIDCVLKQKLSVRRTSCWTLINRIEYLIFNDWQIIGNFLEHCYDDIEALGCGRIPMDPKSLSQTNTLKCLQSPEVNLKSECQTQIMVLQGMKYDTLQLDKIIFTACYLDQKEFCPEEASGSWLMYKCLLRHKYEKGMRKKCQEQLFYDQRNMVMNYKMSKGLARACKEDIRRYHCRKGVVEHRDVRLAQILLCLENVSRNESTKLSSECTAEMIDHRKMLMEDYRLSPELMQNCASDITLLCNGIEAGGKTIHCLMDHARLRKRKERGISLACQKSLELLVQETDPGEDWRVDPILRNACKSVVDKSCREIDGGNGRIMSCLMENIGTDQMSQNCEAALLQIQYFISRDFRLDPQLYKACKYDSVTICKAKLQWADINEHQSEKDPLVLPCLYNYAYNPVVRGKLTPGCESQVRRVMRQRAMSVDLLPEIEDYCMDDLINLCFENTGRGEELSCLQTKIKDLKPKCREIVSNFTETQSGHIELNAVVNVNCRVPIERLCASELKSKKEGDDDIMDCLIAHKNHPDIKSNLNCKAAIDHEQLISLKNYRFTRKFKNACKSYVVRFCPKAQTKNEVVICLSEIVRNDTITKTKHRIAKDCRQQLRQQLFQQKENIELDPELNQACKNDLAKHCNNVPHGEAAALECLQTTKANLTDACRRAIFGVRKQEFTDNGIDYRLITSCNSMIDMYCHNTNSSNVLQCLKAHRQESNFDENCKVVIVNRMIEQNMDYRFNNNLQIACKSDITDFCANIIANEPQDMELQGKMLYCLKEKFRESKLTKSCEHELANVLKEQALNFRLDPLLSQLCKPEIQTICAVSNEFTNADGQVEECLKNALLNHKIVSGACAREVAQIIEETEVDIEADPLLERACALDLLKYCKDLEHGSGRRLKCLKIILNDGSRKLETECEKALSNRLEMYKQALNMMEGLGDVYNGISSSPSKKYFLVVGISIIGLIFICGLYCGSLARRAMYVKRK